MRDRNWGPLERDWFAHLIVNGHSNDVVGGGCEVDDVSILGHVHSCGDTAEGASRGTNSILDHDEQEAHQMTCNKGGEER